jgi:hypothetical protein
LGAALSANGWAQDGGNLDIVFFGGKPNDSSDTTPAVRQALAAVKSSGAKTLNFAPGRYDFWPDHASEKFYYVANNDPGMKRIAFPLDHISDLTIDGHGAVFVFHGYICPFILDHAKNITLKNLAIDWQRPFDSEAKIISVSPDGPDLQFSSEFPYSISKGILTFVDREAVPNIYPAGRLLEFDSAKRETAYMASDQSGSPDYIATEIEPGHIHLHFPEFKGTPGNVIVFENAHRDCPAIIISDSDDTTLSYVTVYHAGGMGVIAQRSRNLTYDHLAVTPPPSNLRMYSATADATHFADCYGQITMTHCTLENQGDDATNIHGIYVLVTKKLSPTEMVVELVHPQQWGCDFIVPGEKLELVHTSNLETFAEATVKAVKRLNSEYTRVTVTAPLPELTPGQVLAANVDSHPDVLVRDCYVGQNRARGLLLGVRGKIVIENNTFHTAGAAILFGDQYQFWFEQNGVRDCTIRNNHFLNCNYGTWESACIQVSTKRTPMVDNRYNRNIDIENNVFDIFFPCLLKAIGVDGLIFRNNTFNKSTAYPPTDTNAQPYDIQLCEHVDLQKI